MHMLTITLNITSPRWKKAFPAMRAKVEKVVAHSFEKAKKPVAFKGRAFEVNIVLSDDAKVRRLNREYRDKDKPTNVLSFPQIDIINFKPASLKTYPPDMPLSLGDIILAFQTIKRECVEQSKALEQHTIHLIAHGVLHVLGYDHIKLKDAKIMESLECDILRNLGYPDPYADVIIKKGKR